MSNDRSLISVQHDDLNSFESPSRRIWEVHVTSDVTTPALVSDMYPAILLSRKTQSMSQAYLMNVPRIKFKSQMIRPCKGAVHTVDSRYVACRPGHISI